MKLLKITDKLSTLEDDPNYYCPSTNTFYYVNDKGVFVIQKYIESRSGELDYNYIQICDIIEELDMF